jgi:tetratricopeptide (TPR) repeat protein
MTRFFLAWTVAASLIFATLGLPPLALADDVKTETAEMQDTSADNPPADYSLIDEIPADKQPTEISPRVEAHLRFLRLNDEERYLEAGVAAQEVVDLTINEFGPDSMELVTPLINLATTQMRNGPLASAEANYKRCVTIIESHQGILSGRLINPLIGLGATYNRLGLYEQAVQTYERALRINHVNDGFYNFEQFKIHDGLTESYIGLEEIEDANFFQESQLEIYQRKAGINSPDIVPGLYKLAQWYERSGQIELAMQSYRKADTVIRKGEGGETDPKRIRAMEGEAYIYERAGNPSASASMLKKALSVVDANPEVDLALRASLLVRLGDLYTRSVKSESAEKAYAEAWENLSRDETQLELRDSFFANPVRVAGRPLANLEYAPNTRKKAPESLTMGHVMISYTVQPNGQTANIRVVESDPAGLMEKSLVSTFSRSLFRAKRVAGVATVAENQIFQLNFRYAKDEKPKRSGEAVNTPESTPEPQDKKEEPEKGRLSYPE